MRWYFRATFIKVFARNASFSSLKSVPRIFNLHPTLVGEKKGTFESKLNSEYPGVVC